MSTTRRCVLLASCLALFAGQAPGQSADPAPMVISASLHNNLGFNVGADFAPVSLITTAPNVLVVGPAGPASVKELAAQARTAPGLNAEIVKAIGTASVHEDLLGKGFLPTTSTPERFAALMEADRKKWAAVIKQSGVKPD